MKETKGDIWDYHDKGHWIVITTNGTVRVNGEAVMGSGVALQARQKFPDLPRLLSQKVRKWGNIPFAFLYPIHIITFPVKHNWREKANLELITESCKKLSSAPSLSSLAHRIYMVRPGCGSGRLAWEDVKPILEKYLDDRFIVVERIETAGGSY